MGQSSMSGIKVNPKEIVQIYNHASEEVSVPQPPRPHFTEKAAPKNDWPKVHVVVLNDNMDLQSVVPLV